ncbi:hypothetical protein C2869_08940 [Saccharobesus litoralis]|uniref:Uncharacterized protein n=1 Tax=Saccharobesus litoralis TaxID=2172099 RepID=A0A2S0VQQ7_9ALTE|nr:hypothetical protein C2869_08940 [Saccharobesus litoralis]
MRGRVKLQLMEGKKAPSVRYRYYTKTLCFNLFVLLNFFSKVLGYSCNKNSIDDTITQLVKKHAIYAYEWYLTYCVVIGYKFVLLAKNADKKRWVIKSPSRRA